MKTSDTCEFSCLFLFLLSLPSLWNWHTPGLQWNSRMQ